MTKKEQFSAVLPFSGFYGSRHSEAIDHVEQQMFSFDIGEIHNSLYEMFYSNMDYGDVYEAYAKQYVEQISHLTNIKFVFGELVSPKEYNFTTDRIFVTIDRKSLAKIIRLVRGEKLNNKAKEMFTSRSGFISYYSNNVSDWGKIEEWDHNQIGCALEALFDYYKNEENVDLEKSALENISEDSGLDNILYDCVSEKSSRAIKIFEYLRLRQERKFR
jgi:hypothetical protein